MSNIEAVINQQGYVTVKQGDMQKNISFKDFLNVLAQMDESIQSDSTVNFIKYPTSVHSVAKTQRGYLMTMYFPETEADLVAYDTTYTTYIPNVIIQVELMRIQGQDGSFAIGTLRWYATDKTRGELRHDWQPSSTNHIWTLPFPNMYSNASMCIGGNVLPSVIYSDWTVLDMLYTDVFLGSAFNNDLSIHSLNSSYSGIDPDDWLSSLENYYNEEDTTRFPYERLRDY